MRANDGVCSIEIANDHVGFFAQMLWCLYILQYCQRHGLIPDIRLTGNMYLDRNRGPNWFSHYFDLLQSPPGEATRKRIRYTKKISEWEDMGQPFGVDMSIDEAASLLHHFIRPKPHIVEMVDDFWNARVPDQSVLGVHFRGTDKLSEAPRVSWAHFIRAVEICLQEQPQIAAVFVASDEQAFIDFIAQSVNRRPVYWHDDHYRSSDGKPVHTNVSEVGAYEKGEDALVNALLLAKCTTLIRTTSFLSAWASIFNPSLRVVLLNKPYEDKIWYPESEILIRSSTRYFPENAR